MRYAVTIAERTVDVEIEGDRVLVDGVPHHAELRAVAGTPVMNLLLDGRSWIIPMESTGRGTWAVQRRGDRFDVGIRRRIRLPDHRLDEPAVRVRDRLAAHGQYESNQRAEDRPDRDAELNEDRDDGEHAVDVR